MFTDKTLEVVSFDSISTTKKSVQSAGVETAGVTRASGYAQTSTTRDVETQTAHARRTESPVDHEKLARFLRKIVPDVLVALDEVHGTDAFEDYDPRPGGPSTFRVQLITQIDTLCNADAQMKISGSSWNISGGTLAVSHSVAYHETWCDHISHIQFYNVNRQERFDEIPIKKLEVSACVTTLSYHPTEPSVIAAGLFNGDVLLWNLRDDDSVTPTQVCAHEDVISQILWRPRTVVNGAHVTATNSFSVLVSSSKDGYIFIYKLTADFTKTERHMHLKISREYNPAESSRPRSASGKRERAAESGLCVTCFDFSPKTPTLFVVGTICGGLYKCSLDRCSPVLDGTEELVDPVIDEYERQRCSITCIKSSLSRDLFVTSGTNKEIRIYFFEERACGQSISVDDTVIGLTWMIGTSFSSNCEVFATYGAGSAVKLYNVIDGNVVTDVALKPTEERVATTCMCVNSKGYVGYGKPERIPGNLEDIAVVTERSDDPWEQLDSLK